MQNISGLIGSDGYGYPMGQHPDSQMIHQPQHLLYGQRHRATAVTDRDLDGTHPSLSRAAAERLLTDFFRGKTGPLLAVLARYKDISSEEHPLIDQLITAIRQRLQMSEPGMVAEETTRLSCALWQLADQLLAGDDQCRMLDQLAEPLIVQALWSRDRQHVAVCFNCLSRHTRSPATFISQAVTAGSQPAEHELIEQAQWELVISDPSAPLLQSLGDRFVNAFRCGSCQLSADQVKVILNRPDLVRWRAAIIEQAASPEQAIPYPVCLLIARNTQPQAITVGEDALRGAFVSRINHYQLPADQLVIVQRELHGLGIDDADQALEQWRVAAERSRQALATGLNQGNTWNEHTYIEREQARIAECLAEICSGRVFGNEAFRHFISVAAWREQEISERLHRRLFPDRQLYRQLDSAAWRNLWKHRLSYQDGQLRAESSPYTADYLCLLAMNAGGLGS